jgi:hypothetical protein
MAFGNGRAGGNEKKAMADRPVGHGRRGGSIHRKLSAECKTLQNLREVLVPQGLRATYA